MSAGPQFFQSPTSFAVAGCRSFLLRGTGRVCCRRGSRTTLSFQSRSATRSLRRPFGLFSQTSPAIPRRRRSALLLKGAPRFDPIEHSHSPRGRTTSTRMRRRAGRWLFRPCFQTGEITPRRLKMAISRNENVVDGGLGQPSAGVRSFLALFGSEHRTELIVKFLLERIGFARGLCRARPPQPAV